MRDENLSEGVRDRKVDAAFVTPPADLFARRAGLKLAYHDTYLSESTLKFWDTGARPLSAALIEMAARLKPADRREVKRLWLESSLPLLREMLQMERASRKPGGYHLAVLEKN